MKIGNNKVYINTGGGLMVLVVDVIDDHDLKSIGLNDECIVGYNIDMSDWPGIDEHTVQFVAYNLQELVDCIPQDAVKDIIGLYKEYLERYKLNDEMGLLMK